MINVQTRDGAQVKNKEALLHVGQVSCLCHGDAANETQRI